jgi:hypothetical protein
VEQVVGVLGFEVDPELVADGVPVEGPVDERETVKQEIQKWYEDLNMAIQMDDRIALRRLHAPKFQAIHGFGYVDSLA